MKATIKNAQLEAVVYNDPQNVELQFVDTEKQELWTISRSKQKYDEATHTRVDDPSADEAAERWAHENFDLAFANLTDAVGTTHDIYVQDNIKSLSPINHTNKFDVSMVGKTLQSKIDEVKLDDRGIHILFTFKGDKYQTNYGFQTYVQSMEKYMNDPAKRERQINRFKEAFDADIDDLDSLKGTPISVTVKSFSGHTYTQASPIAM